MKQNEISNNKKILASWAVFSSLYNNDKDIYDILCSFIEEIIFSKKLYTFTVSDIHKYLEQEYSFEIPDAIVKSSLNRIKHHFTILHNQYTVINMSNFNLGEFSNIEDAVNKNHDMVFEKLFEFVINDLGKPLDENDKKNIIEDFVKYLLDNTNNNGYSQIISAFIIANQANQEFLSSLDNIKEGFIIYTGLKYSPKKLELGNWKTKLTIYLDTEILFHFRGYNGTLYEDLFNDFFKLVKEINSKSKKISLKYFQTTKEEIEHFFKKAEYIIEGQSHLNPANVAMGSIVIGCESKADVISRKIAFFEFLKTSGIFEEETIINYEDTDAHKYNIISKELVSKFSNEFSQDIINENLTILNYISNLRGAAGKNNLENVGCILLSGKYSMLKMAWDEDIKNVGSVPLATDLYFLTNRFWFKLNKGFGGNDVPKSFSVITKAQILLSATTNNKVHSEFQSLERKIETGYIKHESADIVIGELRQKAKKPEEITSLQSKYVIDFLRSEEDIGKYLKEKEHIKAQAEKAKIQAESLEKEVITNKLEIAQLEMQNREKENQLLSIKEDQYADLKEKERVSIHSAEKVFLFWRNLLIVGLIVYSIGAYVFFYDESLASTFLLKIFPDEKEIICGTFKVIRIFFALPIVVVVVKVLYTIIHLKKYEFSEILQSWKEKIYFKQYQKNGFDKLKFLTLENEIIELKKTKK